MKNQKILIFTDIHGSQFAMQRILRVINKENPTKVVFLGDILYHGPRNPLPKKYNPMGVVELINSIQVPVKIIQGNCDADIDQMVLGKKLQTQYTINLHGKKYVCTHGHLLDKIDKTNVDTIIYGHFHLNKHTVVDGVNMVNIASASLPKENCKPAYARLTAEGLTVLELGGKKIFEVK